MAEKTPVGEFPRMVPELQSVIQIKKMLRFLSSTKIKRNRSTLNRKLSQTMTLTDCTTLL